MMFTEILCLRANQWKQPVKIKQIMVHPYDDMLCSHLKKKKIELFVLMWTKLQDTRRKGSSHKKVH